MSRQVAIEIFAPIAGIHTELAPSMITPISSPFLQNANAIYGNIKKDWGTSLHSQAPVGSLTVIDDEDMADITDWGDADAGGDSSQVTFDSKSCMKLDSGAVAAPNKYAARSQDIGTFSATTSFTLNLYFELVGTLAHSDYFWLTAYNGSIMFSAKFASDGLFISDGVTDNEVGTNLIVADTWQKYTFLVHWTTQTVDVYLDDVLIASAVDCSYADATANGNVTLLQYGTTTVNQITYIDSFNATTIAVTGAPLNLLYEAPFTNAYTLEAFTHTGMYKYINSSSWANDGQVYTGTFTDFWNVAMHNDQMFYTNGIDPLQYKATYSATGTNEPGALAANTYKAFALVSFKEHLNLYHTEENGTECPKRIRWTKVGILGNTASDWSTGTAGFLDVQDSDGQLLTALKIGDGMVAIYFEQSIHIQSWVGGATVYQFDKMITNVNIPTRRCVVADGSTHYVLTRTGIYTYQGGSNWTKISNPIDDYYKNLVNIAALDTAWLQFLTDVGELRVYVPEVGYTKPNVCWVYKTDYGTWFKSLRPYNCSGTTTRSATGLTIGELQGTIGEQDWKFGDMIAQAEAPIYILGDSSGYVSKMDKTVYSIIDNGTAVAQEFIFDTLDMSSKSVGATLLKSNPGDPLSKLDAYYMDEKNRWQRLTAELKGSGSVLAQYSTDSGTSWTNFPEGAKALTGDWSLFQWDVDLDNPKLRVRFYNNGTNESIFLRYIKMEFIVGSRI